MKRRSKIQILEDTLKTARIRFERFLFLADETPNSMILESELEHARDKYLVALKIYRGAVDLELMRIENLESVAPKFDSIAPIHPKFLKFKLTKEN